MPTPPRTPTLKGQVLTGALFVALAVVITVVFHPAPRFAHWQAGEALGVQLQVAAAFALVCAAGAVAVLRVPALRRRVRAPVALPALDLRGATPWVVGLCAGVGEEALFRAALQPLVGIWWGSALFAAAHVKTAMLGSPSAMQRAAYLVNVFAAGLTLGLVFEHLGLVAAVLMHATVDVVGLLTLRQLAARPETTQPAA